MDLKIKRKLINLKDALIFAVILLCVGLMLFSGKEKTRIAVIAVDGKTVKTVNLEKAADCVFTLEEAPEVTISIKSGEIAFKDSRCPDGLCEKNGYLKRVGDTAACLPYKTVITVKGEKTEFDGVSY